MADLSETLGSYREQNQIKFLPAWSFSGKRGGQLSNRSFTGTNGNKSHAAAMRRVMEGGEHVMVRCGGPGASLRKQGLHQMKESSGR